MDRIKRAIHKFSFGSIGLAVILVLSFLLLWVKETSSNQSTASMLPRIRLEGEYRIADGDWMPIQSGSHISALKGDVTLRGKLLLIAPDDEVMGPVPNGTSVAVYCNHISTQYRFPGMESYPSDLENPLLGENSCGSVWNVYVYEGEDTDLMEIVLHNPHRFGNENAVDEFLDSMYMYGNAESGVFNDLIGQKSVQGKIAGMVFLVISLALLGVALFSSGIQLPYSSYMWLIGLLFFFGGTFMIMSTPEMSLYSKKIVFHTMARELSMMLYTLCMTALCTMFLTDRRRRTGIAAAFLLGGVTFVLLLLSLFRVILLYETNQLWGMVMSAVNLILIGCMLSDFKNVDRKQKLLLCLGMLPLLAGVADYAAAYGGWWDTGFLSVMVFLLLSGAAIVAVLNVIPRNIRAAMKEKELRAELQESRIKVMLSQIQPHYLFNSLSTIKHLCRKEPEEAMAAIDQFSLFLRGSMKVLKETGNIPFEQEISFVENYLYLEKKRFGNKLKVAYDLKASGFLLPALCIQTIVENAVRHGIAQKLDGGTVTIISRENERFFIVSVIDDGKGFDTSILSGEMENHVGISNVRDRLSMMCGGSMEIHSDQDQGTRVDIYIPKRKRGDV